MPEYHIISKNLSKLELELLKIARDRQLLWFEFYLLSPIFSPETWKAYSTFPLIIFSLKPERWRKYSISSVSLVPFLANNLQQASSVKDLNRITTEPILRFTTSIWKFSAIRSLEGRISVNWINSLTNCTLISINWNCHNDFQSRGSRNIY